MRELVLLMALSLTPAAQAGAGLDPKLVEALTLIRDAPDGGALWAYMRIDPIPILFAAMATDADSLYRSDGKTLGHKGPNKAWIVINIRLRDTGSWKLSRLIYHEYIHRLLEQAPEALMSEALHTPAAYAAAMRYLGQRVRPGALPPDAPPDVEASFISRRPKVAHLTYPRRE